MKKILDSNGLSTLWNLIKTHVNNKLTASNIINILGSTAVKKATDADTVDGKHASAFALSSHTHSYASTSHNHNGVYAPFNHTHEGMGGSFGSLKIDGGEIMLANYNNSTFTCYGVTEDTYIAVDANDAPEKDSVIWHKIMFYNADGSRSFKIIVESLGTKNPQAISIGLNNTGAVEMSLVYSAGVLSMTYITGTTM